MSLYMMAEKTWTMAFPELVKKAKKMGVWDQALYRVTEQGQREMSDMVERGVPLEMAREKVIHDLIQNEHTNILAMYVPEN